MTVIEDKFNALLFGGLNLGPPVGAEEPTFDGGAKQRYQFGAIYFHPRVGEAFECHGLILQTYIDSGEEKSGLGYPVTDEMDDPAVPGGRTNEFEFGRMFWELSSGVRVEFDDLLVLPEVVVKLQDHIQMSLGQGETLNLDQLESLLGFFGAGFFIEALRSLLPDLTLARLFDSLSPAEIQDLVDQAIVQDPTYSPPDFEKSLVIECPPGFDTGPLVTLLNQWIGVVEYAYTMPVPVDPSVTAINNPLFSRQSYLGNDNGINVKAAWDTGADGAGTRFIDLEKGWFLGHEDLPAGIPLLSGIISRDSIPHGTGVLGIIVGADNNTGIVGIAPKADCRVISSFEPSKRENRRRAHARVADKIAKAAKALGFGDVLLLEAQFTIGFPDGDRLLPVEVDPEVFKAIQLATKVGVVVVEVAGNGNFDLDEFRDNEGKRALCRNEPAEFKESGAILVAACRREFPPVRSPFSNFGSRVDCCSWGEQVVTTGSVANPTQVDGYRDGQPPNLFFTGTSAATAIIAGACLLVQDLQLRLIPASGTAGKLGPFSMRRMLSNPQNGNGPLFPDDRIGVMPDFLKIILNEYFFI